jgi:hypothetical protein
MSRQGQRFGVLSRFCIGRQRVWSRSRILSWAALHLSVIALAAGLALGVHAAGEGKPQLAVVPSLEIEASVPSDFFVRVGGPQGSLPPQSYIQISGLPGSVTVTPGSKGNAGSWVVPLSALEQLKISVPTSHPAKSEFVIALMGGDGAVLERRTVTLYVGPGAPTAPAGKSETQSPPIAAPTPVPAARTPTASIPSEQKAAGPMQPPPAPADRAQAERLIVLGEEYLAQGRIDLARSYFKRALESGPPIAAMKLAETFDPVELQRRKVIGVVPDPAEARKWYQRALDLGLLEAEARLRRLSSR